MCLLILFTTSGCKTKININNKCKNYCIWNDNSFINYNIGSSNYNIYNNKSSIKIIFIYKTESSTEYTNIRNTYPHNSSSSSSSITNSTTTNKDTINIYNIENKGTNCNNNNSINNF